MIAPSKNTKSNDPHMEGSGQSNIRHSHS